MRTAKPPRGSRLSLRPFYTTLFLISLLTAYSFLLHTQARDARQHSSNTDAHVLRRSSKEPEPECSQVHHAADQCAFIKEYCKDDDAGLLPYLSLYYCHMAQVKGLAFIILVGWLGLLFTTIGIAASDFFSVNLSTIATILGLSESLAGVTFLAFGNGSPDVFSTFAAMSSNSASMAVGELIGAASFITGVVAGSMALVREFRVDKKTYARDICFFIVAVAFTMVFLADGHLRFWECCAMIAYYIVYVITVVLHHWYTTSRRRRLKREGEARSHVYGTVGYSGDELAGEPYRDDPDDVDQPASAQSNAVPDISVLEQGPRIEVEGQPPIIDRDIEESDSLDEDHERMVAAEVASSMRVLRTNKKRSNTLNPIRPSLVGALEFRSALAQLQRESNLKLSNMHGRSYSEAHLHNQRRARAGSDAGGAPAARSSHTVDVLGSNIEGRHRALSSGAEPTSLAPDLLSADAVDANAQQQNPNERSPGVSGTWQTQDGNLAPPPVGPSGSAVLSPGSDDLSNISPRLNLQIPSTRRSSQSGGSSPNTPFPQYTDSPMVFTPAQNEQSDFFLPAPAQSLPQRDRPFADLHAPVEPSKPMRWWPYSVLPPLHILFATLFPTLQGWKEKTIWDKFVSLISVPSILLLVLTLPVVESETNEDDDDASVAATYLDNRSRRNTGHLAPPVSVQPGAIEPESEWERYRRRTISRNSSYHSLNSAAQSSPLLALNNEETLVQPQGQADRENYQPTSYLAVPKPASDVPSISNANDEMVSWNRWLICVQLFTGPLFSVFILWANMREDMASPGKTLLKMMLWTLLASLILLGGLLVLTTEYRRPKYHYILCFMGFIISIAWISTVAGEVVGVLKTLGVILGISEALLGLTIFAAGNSVGDLVADITVARLGYPVMAL